MRPNPSYPAAGDECCQSLSDLEAEDWRGPVKVLTHTHTLVWALTGAEPLGAAAQTALATASW